MAPSFDCVSSLLCAEDTSGIFDGVNEEIEESWQHRNHRSRNMNYNQDQIFGGSGNGGGEFMFGFLPLQSDECLELMLQRENQYFPGVDYLIKLRCGVLDLTARREIVDWIYKVHAHFNFGPLSAYLSINYLDRFLSDYELPKGKAWMMQLLAVSCLSLAAKMEESEVPLSLDLQVGESKFVFEAKTIQRMELLVLTTLKWRMQAITPFSFLDHFLCKINDDQIPPSNSISQSIQLILNTIRGIDFLEFKPSEVAAAVAISVTGENQTVDNIEKAISNIIQHVEKDRVMKCIEMIHDLCLIRNGVGDCKEDGDVGASATTTTARSSGDSVQTVPQTPIGVLDAAAACLSYNKTSDDTTTTTSATVGSCANSSLHGHNNKRRKLNKPFEVEL